MTKPIFFVTKLGAGPLHKALRVSCLVAVCTKAEGAELYERLQAAQPNWAFPRSLGFPGNQWVTAKSDFFVVEVVRSLGPTEQICLSKTAKSDLF
ncbi:hypothetical protein [Paraburkholderia sp.]|uniref:hypothetical protein n=1 Tax=Paraburkholderia sp. TaxID=1926495 RepID=UPI003C7B2E63